MLLMIDNYDSFTYNLVQYLGELGVDQTVIRNDQITIQEIEALAPQQIVISPGPGRPENAGISVDVVKHFHHSVPILGVCLGHQAIGEVFGAKVTYAPQLMHGKTSKIEHTNTSVFKGLPNPFTATRYHSLTLDPETIPEVLEVTAHATDDKAIMGVHHRQYPTIGVQFHPESILTEHGKTLLQNFLDIC